MQGKNTSSAQYSFVAWTIYYLTVKNAHIFSSWLHRLVAASCNFSYLFLHFLDLWNIFNENTRHLKMHRKCHMNLMFYVASFYFTVIFYCCTFLLPNTFNPQCQMKIDNQKFPVMLLHDRICLGWNHKFSWKKQLATKPHVLKLISDKCELGSFKINGVPSLFFVRERPS